MPVFLITWGTSPVVMNIQSFYVSRQPEAVQDFKATNKLILFTAVILTHQWRVNTGVISNICSINI